MDEVFNWRVIRVKMWESGHSFAEIDAMNIEDVGDVVGYWTGKSRGEVKVQRTRRKLQRKS